MPHFLKKILSGITMIFNKLNNIADNLFTKTAPNIANKVSSNIRKLVIK